MSIVISCECGKQLKARDELAGRKAKCPGCGKIIIIPTPKPSVEDAMYELMNEPAPTRAPAISPTVARAPAPQVATRPQPTAPMSSNPMSSNPIASKVAPARVPLPAQITNPRSRERLYLLLILAMIPLAWTTFRAKSDGASIENRIVQTVASHPELKDKFDKLADDFSLDQFLNMLPGHRIDGALLAHDSWGHWIIALASAGIFFGLAMLIFPIGTANPLKLAGIGLFTATVGILFLLGVQWVAEWTYGRMFYGRSVITLVFYILKFIGFSYRAALDPDTNFFVSFFGFTFGVGLCEEICKALPVLMHYRTKATMSWRAACIVGLISGVGFGVSEGITYSSDYYNGIRGVDIYLVRFISCVALHAIWTAAAAIFIYKQQALLNSSESVWGLMGTSVVLVSAPMVLHGLYDTLLKKDYHVGALIAAVASFAWLVWQIETARRTYDEQERPRLPHAVVVS